MYAWQTVVSAVLSQVREAAWRQIWRLVIVSSLSGNWEEIIVKALSWNMILSPLSSKESHVPVFLSLFTSIERCRLFLDMSRYDSLVRKPMLVFLVKSEGVEGLLFPRDVTKQTVRVSLQAKCATTKYSFVDESRVFLKHQELNRHILHPWSNSRRTMPLSKLESLPNELLLDIFETYVNAVDIFAHRLHQLNHRFDTLIRQSQQMHFDFADCRLDDFRYCLRLLPGYLYKITELVLSEYRTPGQINTFLQTFPSFGPFRHLRSLHMCCSGRTIHSERVQHAMLSLVETQIEVLSIKMIHGAYFTSWEAVVSMLFTLTTLRRLSLTFPHQYTCWTSPLTKTSNIESLTITGLHCGWNAVASLSVHASPTLP